jgi:hypothetical protein
MAEVTLLGPSARPMVALGGASAWKTRTIKGITCSFQWLDLSGHVLDPASGACGEQVNACMCLFRPGSLAGAYVIPQQLAYLYGTKDGTPTAHLLTAAFGAAQKLRYDMRDRMAVRNVIDIIIEGLPDLILMPSEAPNDPAVILRNAIKGIEASAKVNGRVVHEEVL